MKRTRSKRLVSEKDKKQTVVKRKKRIVYKKAIEDDHDKQLVYLTPGKESWIRLYDTLPSHLLTNTILDDLWSLCPSEKSHIKLMGRDVELPRFQQTFSNVVSHYRFSGVDHKSTPLPPLLEPFMDYVNSLIADKTMACNICFANWYRDGKDYIGYHSDNEKQIAKDKEGNTFIVSISFGQSRRFLLKPNDVDKDYQCEVMLDHGKVICMGGKCQSTHQHSVPKTTTHMDGRVNLTFRCFVV